ncbi:hypothetical protein GCM10027202_29200 [Microvirgula curvata]
MPDTGSIQTILVCRAAAGEGFAPLSPVDSAGISVALCPVGTQLYAGQAYVLDAGQQQVVDAALGPFDYGYASALWGVSFTTVVGLYLVSHGISLVLNMIRRG